MSRSKAEQVRLDMLMLNLNPVLVDEKDGAFVFSAWDGDRYYRLCCVEDDLDGISEGQPLAFSFEALLGGWGRFKPGVTSNGMLTPRAAKVSEVFESLGPKAPYENPGLFSSEHIDALIQT